MKPWFSLELIIILHKDTFTFLVLMRSYLYYNII